MVNNYLICVALLIRLVRYRRLRHYRQFGFLSALRYEKNGYQISEIRYQKSEINLKFKINPTPNTQHSTLKKTSPQKAKRSEIYNRGFWF